MAETSMIGVTMPLRNGRERILLVEEIKVREMPPDTAWPIKLFPCRMEDEYVEIDDGPAVKRKWFREIIYGRWFYRPDGARLLIGNSKQAAEVLGIQYEVWNKMEAPRDRAESLNRALTKENDSQKMQMFWLAEELKGIAGATFWERLKWAFTGVRTK